MRCITYNIWNYNRPWPERRRLIAGLIVQHKPDVVALQETRHDFRFERGRGQGEQLAELTGYVRTARVSHVYLPFPRVDEGLTLLTRQPPLRVVARHLSLRPKVVKDLNRRLCLGVTLRVDGAEVDIYDTHFALSAAGRINNAIEVIQFISDHSSHRPAVLMGDLNAEPDEDTIALLTGKLTVDGRRGDLLDCWRSAHPDEPGFTYGSFDPVRRIDYVLGRNLPHGVAGAEIIGASAVDGIYPSDHMGIVVDIPLASA